VRNALLTASLVALLFAGCSILAPPDPRLCAAAQSLSAAMQLTATGITADAGGDVAEAQGLATQARTLTEVAHATLQDVPSERHAETAWQGLLEAYAHTAQAANSLLPAYSGSHGMGAEELATATAAMDKARAQLPAMCFATPPDLETPTPS
jgi:hypothetical protein